MRRSAHIILVLVLPLLVSVARAEEITFIVNAENAQTSVNRKDLRDFYYKKKREWADGSAVRFIDRTTAIPARKIFLDKVLNQTAEEVELYWIGQKLYSGEGAPLQERNDRMTIQFVAAFKGAIGYVQSDVPLTGYAVKAIAVDIPLKE